jgi:hypothetical protein
MAEEQYTVRGRSVLNIETSFDPWFSTLRASLCCSYVFCTLAVKRITIGTPLLAVQSDA